MFVYFIKAYGECPLIKIGRSKTPEKRMSQLQIGCPFKLKMIGFMKCRDDSHAKSVEKLAHNIFYKQRRRGEWFKLSEAHRAQIESLIKKCAEIV